MTNSYSASELAAWLMARPIKHIMHVASATKLIALQAENERLREALKHVAKADFLDMSLNPKRSACAIARAAIAKQEPGS